METNEKETKKKKKGFKQWWNDNWEMVLLSIAAGASIVMTGTVVKMYIDEKHKAKLLQKEGDEIMKALSNTAAANANSLVTKVDENIFTDLAPAIEEAVLNNGIKQCHLERPYELDDFVKMVTVDIDIINKD